MKLLARVFYHMSYLKHILTGIYELFIWYRADLEVQTLNLSWYVSNGYIHFSCCCMKTDMYMCIHVSHIHIHMYHIYMYAYMHNVCICISHRLACGLLGKKILGFLFFKKVLNTWNKEHYSYINGNMYSKYIRQWIHRILWMSFPPTMVHIWFS